MQQLTKASASADGSGAVLKIRGADFEDELAVPRAAAEALAADMARLFPPKGTGLSTNVKDRLEAVLLIAARLKEAGYGDNKGNGVDVLERAWTIYRGQ